MISYAASSNDELQKKLFIVNSLEEYYPPLRSQKDLDNLNLQRQEEIKWFANRINQFSNLVSYATGYSPSIPDIQDPDFTPASTVIDQVVPIYAIVLSLLIKPGKIKERIPSPGEMIFGRIRQARIRFFKSSLDPSDVQCAPYPYPVEKIHYALYHYKMLVAELQNNKLRVYSPHLLSSSLEYAQSGVDTCDATLISQAMVEEVIQEGLISEIYRDTLMKWVGTPLNKALLKGKPGIRANGIYGNLKRCRTITRQELSYPKYQNLSSSADALLCIYTSQIRTLERNAPKEMRKETYSKRGSPVVKKVFKCLVGKSSVSALDITSENAKSMLKRVKVIAWKTRGTNCISLQPVSFVPGREMEILSAILRCLPKEKSTTVFLKTLDPVKLNDPMHWMHPRNFVSERAAQQGIAFAVSWIIANTLNRTERLPGLIGVKGGSCVGKSTLYPVASSPDNIKWMLRFVSAGGAIEVSFLNSQVHEEGKMVYTKLLETLKNDHAMKYVIDERLMTPELVYEKLIVPGLQKGCPVYIHDLECSSIVSPMLRVLKRSGSEKSPAIDTRVIVRGYRESLLYRKEVLDLVSRYDIVEEYKLYLDGRCVGEKQRGEQGKWIIYDESAFRQCVEPSKDLDDRIEAAISQEITEALIDSAIEKRYIRASEREGFLAWKGWTLREAVDMNARGERPHLFSFTST